MTIRETIDGLMADPEQQESFQNDPAAFLDQHELGDIPADLVDTAFVHYADTAPIEHADALAPLVTRVGPVPLDETDLPDGITDELGEGSPPDPWSMISFESAPAVTDESEIDPAGLDDADELPTEAPDAAEDASGPDFGAGEATIADGFDDDDLGEDPFLDDLQDLGESEQDAAESGSAELDEAPTIDDFVPDYEDESSSVFTDAISESIGDEEIDPMDLDFD